MAVGSACNTTAISARPTGPTDRPTDALWEVLTLGRRARAAVAGEFAGLALLTGPRGNWGWYRHAQEPRAPANSELVQEVPQRNRCGGAHSRACQKALHCKGPHRHGGGGGPKAGVDRPLDPLPITSCSRGKMRGGSIHCWNVAGWDAGTPSGSLKGLSGPGEAVEGKMEGFGGWADLPRTPDRPSCCLPPCRLRPSSRPSCT